FIKFFCVFCGLFPSNCQCFQMLAQCPAIIRAESCTHDDLHFLDAFLETFVIDDDCSCQHVTVSSKKFCGAVDDDISTKAERVLSKGCHECIVHYGNQIVLTCYLNDFSDVRHF